MHAKALPPHLCIQDAEVDAFARARQVDCATNLHTQGCHLLVHDDVIGTRKVSYIIYLTNPDESWSEADGGHLELYGKDEVAFPDSPHLVSDSALKHTSLHFRLCLHLLAFEATNSRHNTILGALNPKLYLPRSPKP